ASSESVLHLHYRQIIASPLKAVKAVYDHCGMDLNEDVEDRMRGWLDRTASVARPRRPYDLAEFGLDPQQLRECFARYTQLFGGEIERERRGAIGTTTCRPPQHPPRFRRRRRRWGGRDVLRRQRRRAPRTAEPACAWIIADHAAASARRGIDGLRLASRLRRS